MQTTQVRIDIIDNGYVVVVYPQGAAPAAPPTTQFCADKNAVAQYLIGLLVPGATYTPPPATTTKPAA